MAKRLPKEYGPSEFQRMIRGNTAALQHIKRKEQLPTNLNRYDRKLLRGMCIKLWSSSEKSIHVAEPDSTVQELLELGIPVTRENWLICRFADRFPDWAKGCITKPLPGGLEDELPKELQIGQDEED